MPTFTTMNCGILFWGFAATMFCEPYWVGRNILLVGAFNLVLLLIFDGTVRLVSKLCFYCLLLSILWGLEPYYAPPDSDAMEEDYVCAPDRNNGNPNIKRRENPACNCNICSSSSSSSSSGSSCSCSCSSSKQKDEKTK